MFKLQVKKAKISNSSFGGLQWVGDCYNIEWKQTFFLGEQLQGTCIWVCVSADKRTNKESNEYQKSRGSWKGC